MGESATQYLSQSQQQMQQQKGSTYIGGSQQQLPPGFCLIRRDLLYSCFRQFRAPVLIALLVRTPLHLVSTLCCSVLCGLSGSPVWGVSICLADMGLCGFCSSAGVVCCLVLSDPLA